MCRPVKESRVRFVFSDVIPCPFSPQSEMRNVTWADILVKLKQAQREHKMNIRKQELTELGTPSLASPPLSLSLPVPFPLLY